MNQNNKTALVVEGGAMRGIFAAGVLDQFIEMEFYPFHSVLGVSAGAVNAATYLSRQRKRNFKMFTDYSLRPEYISWKKFLAGGHLMDLDWSWDITTRELPIDLDVMFANNPDFEIGVTMNSDGRSVFIKPDAENLSHVMKASCTVPLFYRNFLKIDGQIVSDGGVSAPIPIQRAVEKGAVKIMVIRSRPNSFRMKKGMESKLGRLLFRKHPGLVKALLNRPDNYNSSIDFIQNPPQNLQILDICPPESFKTKRFTQDYATLVTDYELGREMGRIAIEKWNLL
ncbi:patatin family protein [Labilibaculum sp. A4]|uniref:patatin-like phospholipase family protein n=1 Tax=Labilibaculum euxinus TaxID=2686357 RepID=UPI0013660ACB|nr:patatin family protein [Labilibaculum euxinus]MDQ1772521.1 patatin family protein [Labilibaculum euxinus]MWN78193.1 patatin family protein [Labilibaculum euxinus]